MLLKTSIKKNLYYEIKERRDEEVINGINIKRPARRVKVYGSISNKKKRDDLISILHQRVQHHRDKFMTREIYDELCTMVVKPNGKVEHADDAHDDLVFSYLWALYVFYQGEELPTRFHLLKKEIYTDDNYDETSYSLEEEYGEESIIEPYVFKESHDETSKIIEDQMRIIDRSKTISMEDLYKRQMEEGEKALSRIRQTPQGREAIAKHYYMPLDKVERDNTLAFNDHFGQDVMKMWYGNEDTDDYGRKIKGNNKTLTGNLSDLYDRL